MRVRAQAVHLHMPAARSSATARSASATRRSARLGSPERDRALAHLHARAPMQYDNFFFAADGFKTGEARWRAGGRASERACERARLISPPPACSFLADYGGHDSRSHDNVIVVREYDGQACYNAGDYNPGHETWIFGNKCVVPMGSDGTPNEMIGHTGSACKGGAHGTGPLMAWNNSYYTPLAEAMVGCDGGEVKIADMPPPFELGSTSNLMPTALDIVSWGRAKLLLDV